VEIKNKRLFGYLSTNVGNLNFSSFIFICMVVQKNSTFSEKRSYTTILKNTFLELYTKPLIFKEAKAHKIMG